MESSEFYRNLRDTLNPVVRAFIPYTVENPEKIPKEGPLIIIANHRSDLDPLLISSVIDKYISWLAASYDFSIPVIGKMLENLGMIPVSYEKSAQRQILRDVKKVLTEKRFLGIFPEGDSYITENDFSRRLGTFTTGYIRFALKFKSDILPIAVIGIKEKKEAWLIPRFIREMLKMPEHTLDTRYRLSFTEAKLVIGNVIRIKDFSDMPYIEAEKKILDISRGQIEKAILNFGEPERRKVKSRQSGTRIRPDEQRKNQN